MSKCVGIQQPNYLPWLGYFYKIKRSSKFILLDTVDIQTGNAFSLTNRTKIKTAQGEQWLTVPIRKGESKIISDILIDNVQPWKKRHLNAVLIAYKKSSYFEEIYSLFESIILKENEKLAELNSTFINVICNYLKINTPLINASTIDINKSDKNERIIAYCKYLKADTYISGTGGKKYNNPSLFEKAGLKIEYLDYKLPVYNQLYGDFIPGLSILDVLFNYGKETSNYL